MKIPVGLKKVAERGVWIGAAACFLLQFTPRQAQAQFGLDTAAILAGLQKINSLLTSQVAGPLKTMQQIQQQEQTYSQDILFPIQAINQAKALATSFQSTLLSMQSLMNVKYSSATMPATQQLEQQVLSGNANNITSLGSAFTQVYGALPAPSAAPQQVRNTIDIGDAHAQDAMKKAIQLDALAAREMEVAQSINQQLTTAAPGSAGILEAEASAWIVQGNAYSQSALAELLRVRSAQLSNQGGVLKTATSQTQQLNQNVQGILTPR